MSTEYEIAEIIDERYRVIEELGSGGFATVYSAIDTALNQSVAIKILSHTSSTIWQDDRKQRFFREGKALSQLDHPGIVRVHRIGLLPDGRPFLVMNLVQGQPLNELIDPDLACTCAEAADVCVQLAAALVHAHSNGVIHRDVKPQNIIISQEGRFQNARLVDFGLSTLDPADGAELLRLTHTGAIMGTPEYMSPEQCRGLKADARSDIYSLGCVFFEMLVGSPPFKTNDGLKVIWHHVNTPIPILRNLDPHARFPVLTQKILNKSLAKDADLRYQTADDMLADLLTLQSSQSDARFSPRKIAERNRAAQATPKSSTSRNLALSAIMVFVLAGAVTGIALNTDSSLAVVDICNAQLAPAVAQSLGMSLLQLKLRTQGAPAACDFAVQLLHSISASSWPPSERLQLAMKCLDILGPHVSPKECFGILLYLFDESFVGREGRGKLASPEAVNTALSRASAFLLPVHRPGSYDEASILLPSQWTDLKRCLDRHYEIIADLRSTIKLPISTFGSIKELTALAMMNAPNADADSATSAIKAYLVVALDHWQEPTRTEFDRTLNKALSLEKKYGLPEKRALLWRAQVHRLLFEGKREEARQLFDKVDAIPHFYWVMSDAESMDHNALSKIFYGNGQTK